MQPIITIFCPFTRRWAVDPWIKGLETVAHDPAQTNLCIIVDADEPYIGNILRQYAERRGYRSFHVKSNPDWYPNEVRQKIRRTRIADVNNQAKTLIAVTDGDIIIGLEDDTVFDRLPSFERLYEPIIYDPPFGPRVGFVEGVEMGRWGVNMVGVWEMDDPVNPTHVKTLLPSSAGLYQPITAGGLYCYATRRDLFMNHEFYWSTAQPWGPDVNFGRYIKQQGYECLVDWESQLGHLDFSSVVFPDDPKYTLASITFTKNRTNGKWERTDHENTSGRYRA